TKEMQVYDLVVAKGGPKLTPHVEHKDEPEDAPGRGAKPNLDADGFPIVPRTCSHCIVMVASGKVRMSLLDAPLADLADMLSGQVNKIVNDATELKGKYDMSVTYQ